MECLRELDASGTALKVIPDSIGLMNNLTKLSLNECDGNLKTESRFPFLQFLKASRSLSATHFLPSSVSSLSSLSELDLSCCGLSDEEIPDDLQGLSLLRSLDLRKNIFCILPNSLGQLSNLKRLYLDDCCRLRSILQFPPNLRHLNASGCLSLEELPDLSNMKFLKSLNFEDCSKLVNIQGLDNLNSVKDIYLEGCTNLSTSFEISLFQGDSGRFVNCSIHLPRRDIPDWFTHQRLGSLVSFDAEDDSVEMIIWVDYVQEGKQVAWKGPIMDNIGAVVNNVTRGTKWSHYGYPSRTSKSEIKTWVNHGPQSYPVKTGDRIEVSVEACGDLKVEKCGLHLAYKLVVKATKHSSVVITEVDGDEFMDGMQLKRGHDVGALETSSNESNFSKRLKLE